MRTINWGFVGLGHMANEMAASMVRMHPIYAAASRSREKAEEFAQKYHVQNPYEIEELYEDPNVDIVYIATVNSHHVENIEKALKSGKSVLCEKAICGDSAKLEELYQYAQKNHLLLAEGMTIYHMPIIKAVKELADQGKLGRLTFACADLGSLKEDDPNNRFFSKALGGGAMLDIGTYTISFVNHFLQGNIVKVEDECIKYQTGVDEMWGIQFLTDKKMIGNANMTFRAKMPKRGIVAGEDAYVEIYNYVRADEARIVHSDGTSEVIHMGKTPDALCYEIEDIEKSLQGQDNTYIDETRNVVRIMDELLVKNALK